MIGMKLRKKSRAQTASSGPRKDHSFEIRNVVQLAEEHVNLMQQDRQFIESTGGVTDEMMGRESNAQCGKAILDRQDQRFRRHG